MSLRLTPIVPNTIPEPTVPEASVPEGIIPEPTILDPNLDPNDSGFHPDSSVSLILRGISSNQLWSAKQIPTLFPFVKSSWVEPALWEPDVVGSVLPVPLVPQNTMPQNTWIVQKTLQTTWHLYYLPTPNLPMPSGYPAEISASFDPSFQFSPSRRTSQPTLLPAPSQEPPYQPSRSIGTYLRTLLVFSCGAAVSSLLYGDPVSSLKGLLMGSSLATGVLTPDGTAFIETAQRQLYHLDRLAAQQTHPQQSLAQPLDPLMPELPETIARSSDLQELAASPIEASMAPIEPIDTAGTDSPETYSADPYATDPDSTDIIPPPVPPEESAPIQGENLARPDVPVPPASTGLAYRTNLPLPTAMSGSGSGELLGVLEQGDQSMALFQVNGTIERVAVGERLTNGATFTGTQDGKALLQVGESQVPLAVGQSF